MSSAARPAGEPADRPVSRVSARAELIEDAGAAAAAPEFFRSPPFLGAEGVTHTLRIESGGDELLVPLLVRPIPRTERRDAVSPYGYPGGTARDWEPIDPGGIDWSGTGLVSVFLRDAVGARPILAGGRERGTVLVADPGKGLRLRKSLRYEIRRNAREGYRVESVRGPEASDEQRSGFEAAYAESMSRAGASERYRFDSAYFQGVLGSEQGWLFLARAGDGQIAAGAIAGLSDRHLHYYLSGTRDAHRGDSPSKNVLAVMIELAHQLGLPLNLGGGFRPGDQLESFKRGFSNAQASFTCHEIVCDPGTYEKLGAPAGGGADFFPRYRLASR